MYDAKRQRETKQNNNNNREIDHRRPDITDHVKNNNKVLIIDIAVPSDSSVEGKEREGECLDFGGRRQK